MKHDPSGRGARGSRRRAARAAVLAAVAGAAALAGAGPVGAQTTGATSRCAGTAGIAVERVFAERNGLAVGDRLDIASEPGGAACPAVVRAVYEPRPDPARLIVERPSVRLAFPDLARLAGRPDAADWLTIGLTAGADPDVVAGRLRSALPGLRVLPTGEVTARASTTFTVIERFHRAIAWITLVAGGVFLSCIMFLKVGERRDAIAALRLVGISRGTLVRWVMLEATLIAVLGGALGLGLGAVASGIVNRFYRAAYDTTLVFSLVSPDILLQALALSLVMGIGAGALATARLLSSDPLAEIGR